MRIVRGRQIIEETIKKVGGEVVKTPETDYQDRKYRQRWWTLLVLSVSLILIAIDTTILKGLIYLMPLQPFLLHVKTADGIRCNPEFGAVIP